MNRIEAGNQDKANALRKKLGLIKLYAQGGLTKKNLLAAFLVSIILCPIAKADEVDN